MIRARQHGLMLSAMTVDELGKKLRCGKCGRRAGICEGLLTAAPRLKMNRIWKLRSMTACRLRRHGWSDSKIVNPFS
jgi:hypothetical protein